jgi:AraC family L-rhamnose operon regulatory protein RhaS
VELFWKDLGDDPEQLALEWTVRGMARRCGLGATAFTHYTRQLTNATPMRHLRRRRLAAAARLLREQPDRGVTDVALAVGFASSQYFATAFRAEYGRSPKVFRIAPPNREPCKHHPD